MAKNLSSIFFCLFILFLVVDSSLAVRPMSTTLLSDEIKAIIQMVSMDDGVATMSITSDAANILDGKAVKALADKYPNCEKWCPAPAPIFEFCCDP